MTYFAAVPIGVILLVLAIGLAVFGLVRRSRHVGRGRPDLGARALRMWLEGAGGLAVVGVVALINRALA